MRSRNGHADFSGLFDPARPLTFARRVREPLSTLRSSAEIADSPARTSWGDRPDRLYALAIQSLFSIRGVKECYG